MIGALVALVVLDVGALDVGALDDQQCPEGTYWELPAGAQYDGPTDVWSLDGIPFGTSPVEDACWTPVDVEHVELPRTAALPATR